MCLPHRHYPILDRLRNKIRVVSSRWKHVVKYVTSTSLEMSSLELNIEWKTVQKKQLLVIGSSFACIGLYFDARLMYDSMYDFGGIRYQRPERSDPFFCANGQFACADASARSRCTCSYPKGCTTNISIYHCDLHRDDRIHRSNSMPYMLICDRCRNVSGEHAQSVYVERSDSIL